MTAGIRIYGDHGVLQIDGETPNFGFVQGGTLAFSEGPLFGFQNYMRSASLTVNGTAPIVAFNSGGVPVNQYAVERSGDQWTFRFRAINTSSLSMAYWVFDVASRSLGSSAPEGFRIFDQFGTLVAHGGQDMLKVIDFVTLSQPPDGWNGTSQMDVYLTNRSYPAGKTYAVVQAATCRRQEDYVSPNQADYIVSPGNQMMDRRILYSGARFSGSSVEVGLTTGEASNYQAAFGTGSDAVTQGSLAWFVVDVSGLGSAPPSNDITPNAISWPNASFVTNANYGSVNSEVRTISGFDQPLTLRATVFPVNDNFYDGNVRGYVNGQLVGSHRHAWNGSSIGSFDFTVTNGSSIYFQFDGSTTSGRKTGSAIVRVQNMTNAGQVLNEFGFSGVVDDDNNFGTSDPNLNPVNWPDVGDSTNAEQAAVGNGYQVLSGIDVPITLRHQVTGLTGNLSGGGVQMYINGVYQGECGLSLGSSFTRSTQVVNNDQASFVGYANTNNGTRSGVVTVQAVNVTTGAVIDTFTFALTCDADNSTAQADNVPDAISASNISAYGGSLVVNNSPTYTMTGFTSPVTMRCYFGLQQWVALTDGNSDPFEVNSVDSTGATTMFVVRNGQTVGSASHSFSGSYSGTEQFQFVDVTFSPGDTVQFITHMAINSGGLGPTEGSVYGGIYFDNLTGGNRVTSFLHYSSSYY